VSKFSAQCAAAKKAAARKAALKQSGSTPAELIAVNEAAQAEAAFTTKTPTQPAHDRKRVHVPRAPPHIQGPRLLSKPEVLAIVGCTFPTLWLMMRQGEFPRSRVVGGKSMWLSTEVDAWMAALPKRQYKGDEHSPEMAEGRPPPPGGSGRSASHCGSARQPKPEPRGRLLQRTSCHDGKITRTSGPH